jgi:hypothetical protein
MTPAALPGDAARPPHVRWSRGGEAAVTALDGDRISVISTTPSAPGSRPEGALASGGAFRIKVARCRRHDVEAATGAGSAPSFLIEGRLIDATRETRAELRRLLDPLGRSPA